MSNNWIELYPSNWLYNAGVVGFLKCLDEDEDNLKGYLNNFSADRYRFRNGYIELNPQLFNSISVDYYLDKGKIVNLKGKNPYYQNFIDTHGKQVEVFENFIKAFYSKRSSDGKCDLCNNPIYVDLNRSDEITNKFLNKVEKFGMHHNKLLGPSEGKFPNSSWGLSQEFKVCHLCTFLIIHHHLAFTRLSDGTEIFINAPSFELMHRLNRLVREIAISDSFTGRQVLDILGMSLVELATKIQLTISRWAQMNLEVVVKKNNALNFYTLPQHIVKILIDRDIASILSRIGEFSVLECILEDRYDELLSMAQYSIGAYLKSLEDNAGNKKDHILRQFRNYFRRSKNLENPLETSRMVLSLYAKINDRRVKHGS